MDMDPMRRNLGIARLALVTQPDPGAISRPAIISDAYC